MYSLVPASRAHGGYANKRADEIRRWLGTPRELTRDEAQAAVIAVVLGASDAPPNLYGFNTTKDFESEKARFDAASAKGVPYLKPTTLKAFVPKKLAGKANPRPKDGSPYGRRYYGLNLKSAFKHGTIEFRLHSGTVESQKIIAWGAICASILDFAKTATLDDLAYVGTLNADFTWDWFLTNIVPRAHREYAIQRRAKFAAR